MLPGIVLLLGISFYRLLPILMGVTTEQPSWLYNFSPVSALCLCGAACFPKRIALTVPFFALLGTDMLLTAHYDFPIFNGYFFLKTLAFVSIAAFGWQLRTNPRLAVLVPSAIGSSVFFYLITNTAAWFFEPGYVKSIGGWVQAVTVGLPGFPQTWQFYINTLASDVLFTCLFVASFRFTRRAPKADAIVLSPARW